MHIYRLLLRHWLCPEPALYLIALPRFLRACNTPHTFRRHTHIALHGEYARSCGELFPAAPAPAPATITTTTTTTTTMASATASAASDHAAPSQPPLPDSGTGGKCQGGEGSHSEGSHGEGSHKVGYLFSPDYLRLRGIQLEAAFAETARLYEEQYGKQHLEPQDGRWN